MGRNRQYTANEEKANTLSHAFGILLGILAGFILLPNAAGDAWKVFSVCVYLFGMLASYITSTYYHGSTHPPRKQFLQKLDHASIYLHIAGSYTPFALVTLRNEAWWGWGIFLFVWLSAAVGVLLSFRDYTKHNHLETVCYVVMGCAILVALNPLLHAFSQEGKIEALYWLVAGGASYIIGALFYSLTKMRYMHTIFHLFVLGGSLCHIRAIYFVIA